jgi:hypothetical protein
MPPHFWFWIILGALLSLVLVNRFLPSSRFPISARVIRALSDIVGFVWLALFIVSLLYVLFIGFPE